MSKCWSLKNGIIVGISSQVNRRRGNSRKLFEASMVGSQAGKVLARHLPVSKSQKYDNVPPLLNIKSNIRLVSTKKSICWAILKCNLLKSIYITHLVRTTNKVYGTCLHGTKRKYENRSKQYQVLHNKINNFAKSIPGNQTSGIFVI